jgi:hypothetical protein
MNGRRRTTRPPASFDSQIHQQTTTCLKIVFFSNFFEFIFTEFQNEGGRKPRRPPRTTTNRFDFIIQNKLGNRSCEFKHLLPAPCSLRACCMQPSATYCPVRMLSSATGTYFCYRHLWPANASSPSHVLHVLAGLKTDPASSSYIRLLSLLQVSLSFQL